MKCNELRLIMKYGKLILNKTTHYSEENKWQPVFQGSGLLL
jgi:hypothetical protein